MEEKTIYKSNLDNKLKADEKIRKSLMYSILDGTFYSTMVGIGESFFSAFAVFLKANNIQLGLLGSLPQTLGSISQLFSNKLLKLFKSRKRFVCINAFLEALMYIPIILTFFFGKFRIYTLILFVCIYWIFGSILNPAWNSWVGDLVNEKKRGAYFGKRNKISGMASFISLLIGGFILQNFTNGVKTQYTGFVIIFILALIARIFSFIFLTKKYEPSYNVLPEAEFSFIEFLKKARFRNFGLFVFYLSLMNFSVYIAAPFFVAYMLYDLKLSYLGYTILIAIPLIVKYMSMPIWGKASDNYGTKKILSLTGFLMPLGPILWIFSSDFYYLGLVQAFSGFTWAGFEIASFNFIFDTTSPEKRATCVAYYNVLNGIGIIFGSLLGGMIVMYNNVFWSKYLLVFLISGILRYQISIIFIPKLKEAREIERIPYHKLFLKVISTMPTMGLVYDLIAFRKKNVINVKKIKIKLKR